MSSSPTSPIWVSDNNGNLDVGTGNASTLYTGAGQPVEVGSSQLVVKIPRPDGSDGGAPTGQVFNGSAGFEGAPFIFATEDGTIAAWEGEARWFVHGPADSRGVRAFNIQNLRDRLYVTYALQKPDKHDDLSGPGNGFVDVYDLNGNLLSRLIRHGALNSPWGLAIAPEDFGPFSGELLVGNFGDGRIHAYNPRNGHFRGIVRSDSGAPISISGLWGLKFGNGAAGGAVNSLFFTAGINEEKDGLFGTITSVGEENN